MVCRFRLRLDDETILQTLALHFLDVDEAFRSHCCQAADHACSDVGLVFQASVTRDSVVKVGYSCFV